MDIALISGLAVAAVTVAGLGILALRPARDLAAHDREEFFNSITQPKVVTHLDVQAGQVVDPGNFHTHLIPAAHALPAAANNNWPGLSADQQAVLLEMEEERGVTAAHLSIVTHLPVAKVTKIRRELLAMGLADYGEMMDDDGALRGKSYCLTPTGQGIKAALFQRMADGLAA